MGNDIISVSQMPATTNRTRPGIWPALLIALGLHAALLLLPLTRENTDTRPVSAQIELQLTRFDPPPVIEDIFITEPDPLPPLPTPLVQDEPTPLVEAPVHDPVLYTSHMPPVLKVTCNGSGMSSHPSLV